MAKFDQGKYLTCFSPRVKKNLESVGYYHEFEYEDVKTKRICWVYPRTYELNLFLAMGKYNNVNNLRYDDCQIAKFFREGKLFPNTTIEDYDIKPIL